ncbi:hypothetical protein [Polaromonas sp. UC242_47]|uniref:hypothetical protein n=1 Tax=Polaromonas sp. UC242_47 TaxID=3374626 RepID=UPI003799FE4C
MTPTFADCATTMCANAREQGLTFDETAQATGYSRRQAINIMGGDASMTDMKAGLCSMSLKSPRTTPCEPTTPSVWGTGLTTGPGKRNGFQNRRKPLRNRRAGPARHH